MQAVEDAIKRNPGMPPQRVKKLRGWIKWAKRGFTRAVCPPLLEDLVIAAAREQCAMGDPNMCRVFIDLGGEVNSPIT